MSMNQVHLSLFLAILLSFSRVDVFAYDAQIDGIYYNFSGTEASVTCGSTSGAYSGKVVIPVSVTYNGETYSVTKIDDGAFSGSSSLTSINIPEGVTSIGNNAFYSCRGLTSISIPKGVTSIGNYAFYNCSGLTSITIPEGVTSIGNYAFSGCSGLTSLIIGSGVTTIGSNAFSTKPQKTIWLTNTPPNGYKNAIGIVNYVSNNQFSSLPNTIVYPFLSSMFDVDGIRYVPVSPSDRTCDAIDCVYDSLITDIHIGKGVAYKGIEMSVKEVKPYTCYRQPYITSAAFDLEGNIGNYAFYNCTALKEVTMNNYGDVGDSAFKGCTALKAVEANNNGAIGTSAFSDCTALEKVVLDSITSIGPSAFSGCSSLLNIKFPDATSTLGSEAFRGCSSLKSVDMGKGVSSIGNYAFSGCSSLPQIVLPQSLARIDNYVFQGCSELKTVVMEEQGSNAETRELSLGSNGSSPLFANCPLDSVYIGRNIAYSTESGKGYSPFYRNTSLRAVTITDKETEISPNEFYGCTNLKNVRVGDGVTTIGDWAFSGCSSLDYFAFGVRVSSIGKEAFSDCTSVSIIKSRANQPPICGLQALDDINKWNCMLIVPKGKSSSYKESNQWKDFFFIEEGDIEDDYIPVNSIELDKRSLSLVLGETEVLNVTIHPENASDKSVNWSSSDNTVCSVDTNGKITALKIGRATISATSNDGHFKDDCIVYVRKSPLTSTSPWVGEPLPKLIGTYYLYNVETGLWLQHNRKDRNFWTTRAQVDVHGLDFIITKLSDACYQINPRFGHNNSINGADEFGYMDTSREVTSWNFFPYPDVPNSFEIVYGEESALQVEGIVEDNDKANYFLSLSGDYSIWQLVSKEERLNDLETATENNPKDATWLIGGWDFANEDERNSNWKNEIVGSGSGIAFREGYGNWLCNRAAECWSQGVGEYYQDIKGLPNGTYGLTVQGFYRDGSTNRVLKKHQDGSEVIRAFYFANDVEAPFMSICDNGVTEEIPNVFVETSGFYGPGDGGDGLPRATNAFLLGYYKNTEIKVEVTDNTLRIGIRKDSNVKDDWLTFDNFQLTYYGKESEWTIIPAENVFEYTGKSPSPSFTCNDGGKVTIDPTVSFEKNVGSYSTTIPLTIEKDGSSYSIDYLYSYEIKPAKLKVQVKGITRLYGENNPVFESLYSGFVNGEDVRVINQHGVYTTSATAKSDVGKYLIKQSGAKAQNYIFEYMDGILEITPAPLIITANDASIFYFSNIPILTYKYQGFMGNDDEKALGKKPSIQTTATMMSPVGTYSIEVSGAEAKNYTISYENGTMDILKRRLTVSTKDYTRAYGEDNPEFEISYNGFVNNEDERVLLSKPQASTTATKRSDVGSYKISVGDGEAQNYEFSYIDGVLTIEKAYQTLSWEQDFSDAKQYDQLELMAEASSGLAITYSIEGDNIGSITKIGTKQYLDCSGAGEAIIVAQQEGDKNYWQTTKMYKPIKIVPTAVQDLENQANHVESIYDASGRKLSKLQRGVNVVVMNDGTKKKVVVK